MVSRQIFFLVDMRTSFEERILRGIARFARSQLPRWQVRWGSELNSTVCQQNDGLILFAKGKEVIANLRSSGLPTVATSTRHLDDGFPCVVTDDFAIGQLAAQHFREKFYRSFAFFGHPELTFSQAREKAFARALAPDHVCSLTLGNQIPFDQRFAKLKESLELLPPHTAIFCANDISARSVLIELERSHRKVPYDLAVLGVDADELVGLSCPVNLSSIDSAPEQIGFQAAALVAEILKNPDSVRADTVIRIPPVGLAEASSTDALASSDERIIRAVKLLQQHAFERDYTIDKLARDCGCSRRTLEIRFAELSDRGINAHLWGLRMDRAKELLQNTHLPLTQIADQCGFASPYHFCQKFKRETGQTPGAFRQEVN